MTGVVAIELAAFGPLNRNANSVPVVFHDPLPAGARLVRLEVAVAVRPLFYDLFGKGVVAGQRFFLAGEPPFTAADLIGSLATFGPAPGQAQAAVTHTFVFAGSPPRYARGGRNLLLIGNDYNPVEVGPVRLVCHFETGPAAAC